MSTNTRPTVEIILATYNGEKYLPELLKSIESQTFPGWKLLARDDCSSDFTIKMLLEWQNKHKDKVVLIDNENIRLGACKSFEKLLEKTNANFILFADQDDIWLPNKIEWLLKRTIEIEKNSSIPFLLFSDMRIENTENKMISASFAKYYGTNFEYMADAYYIAQRNIVPGCSMMINGCLKEEMLPISSFALMHDWWAAIIAAKDNRLFYIEDITMTYRLHEKNTVGINVLEKVSERISKSLRNPSGIFDAIKMHVRLIRQGKRAFKRINKKFSTVVYIGKILIHRWIIPLVSSLVPSLKRYSWR
jgi:glycosyltransferase involved in cell wall biosynthesis